jgi:hypothetical protein
MNCLRPSEKGAGSDSRTKVRPATGPPIDQVARSDVSPVVFRPLELSLDTLIRRLGFS